MFLYDGSVLHHEHTRVRSHDCLERHGVDGTEDLFCCLFVQADFLGESVNVIFSGTCEEITSPN